ncbi:MAG TPA: DUF1697 domain-containing protein [Acidimicrobiales bacterium]|nr:DUF1697 domain-containing protein [Acidimicrobiales bacterium]
MGIYVALLRGINVGGRAKVAMSELRGLFDDLGYPGAKTYIQSGNVVFTASLRTPARAASDIAARIEKDLGVRCSVLLRTGADIATVLKGNPYVWAKAELSQLYVTFLDTAPNRTKAAELMVPKGETAEFTIAGREIYLRYPDGYGRTKFNNTYIEKRLGVVATTRNWNTVTKLHELASTDSQA